MRTVLALSLQLVVASTAMAAQPRISFARTIPAAHDLGQAEEVAILYAIGDNERLPDLLETFAERVNDSNLLRVRDTTLGGRRFTSLSERPDAATIEKLRRSEPADTYLGVKEFTCRSEERGGEGTTLDADRNKVKKRHVFLDAICTARFDVISGTDLRRVSSFTVKGEGTSPRVSEITDEERAIALRQATRYAAIDAAEHITPRRVRESIPLDETAPEFDHAMAMIDALRPEEARAIWTEALKKHRASAALHYNLAAVAEALGDVPAAEKHYVEARRLEPKHPRYREELRSFLRRNGKAAAESTAAPPR
jgi:tetratricopeptide (TPR) repeat protein